MAKEEAGAAGPARTGRAHVCTVRPLCPGPDNGLHSSPTSVTSFTDMSPEAIFRGLISYSSDDKAFLPQPISAQAVPFLCLDHRAGG